MSMTEHKYYTVNLFGFVIAVVVVVAVTVM